MTAPLQWGSETGSRRRLGALLDVSFRAGPSASMGLRDWVSEKGPARLASARGGAASMGLRDWVSEKGGGMVYGQALANASMGLRDWVSEKVE